jgi:hypothetical protein
MLLLWYHSAAYDPECAPPGMLDDATTMTVTPGLSLEFTHPVKSPVSKLGLRTSWGHVGCAVALTVTVVVVVDTEVTVCVDGGVVGQVLDPD